MTIAAAAVRGATGEEELARALTYRLLAQLLAAPPDAATLAAVARLGGDASPLGEALATLGRVAAATDPHAARDEYHELFIGLGRGELVPYGSFYLTGFLNEKPLAELRQDLGRMRIRRAAGNSDPEDHVAALCEVMAGLIEGEHGEPDLGRQRAFFDRHLGPWAGRFFGDLERARSSRLYVPVGTLGRLFVGIEATAFAMLD